LKKNEKQGHKKCLVTQKNGKSQRQRLGKKTTTTDKSKKKNFRTKKKQMAGQELTER